MKLKYLEYSLDAGAFPPVHAHNEDAGYDLLSPETVKIPRDGSIVIYTGVHFKIPEGYYGKIEGKSGLNIKYSIVALGGVIDAGYSGSVVVKLYNFGNMDYFFQRGDKIAQIIFHKISTPRLVLVDKVEGGERGDNGFGSTGK